MDKHKQDTGFRAFDDLVSNVDTTIAEAEAVKISPATEPITANEPVASNINLNKRKAKTVSENKLLLVFGSLWGLIIAVGSKIPPFWLVIIAIAIVGSIAGLISDWYKSSQIADFKPHIAEYLAYQNYELGKPRLSGKVLPINKNTNEVDEMYFNMSESMRASKHNEVAAVVTVSCSEQQIGKYTDGAAAIQIDCSADVIDKSTSTDYHLGDFTGSEPPKSKKGSGPVRGSRPTNEIIAAINALY